MKKIAIIGTGQSGLLLAHGLLQQGHVVTLFSKSSPDQIRNSRVTSSQVMFSPSLEFERALGLNFWDEYYPYQSNTIHFNLCGTDISWTGKVKNNFQTVDQRLKFSKWLELFEEKKGNVIYKDITQSDILDISEKYDLTIVCTGKSELYKLFPIDLEKTLFHEPMRELALVYMKGMQAKEFPGVSVNIIPGKGEFFTTPGLGIHDNCEMFLFEAIPGTEFDCWKNLTTEQEVVTQAKKMLGKYVPREADRIENLEITHSSDYLIGSYTPFVRKPYITHNNKLIMGMGDAIILNDPVAGQGANNATKFAEVYLEKIVNNETDSYGEEWANDVSSAVWEKIKPAVDWTNKLLLPPEPHVIDLLKAAKESQDIANLISTVFENPSLLFPWINSSESTKKLIQSYSGEVSHA